MKTTIETRLHFVLVCTALSEVRARHEAHIPALTAPGLRPVDRLSNILLVNEDSLPLPPPQAVGNFLSDMWYERMSPRTMAGGELQFPVY